MRDFDAIKKKEMCSIENRVRHVYNIGYETGYADGTKVNDGERGSVYYGGYGDGYNRGVNDLWESVCKFMDVDITLGKEIWGCVTWEKFAQLSPSEVIERLKEYNQKHYDLLESIMRGEINIGDEVTITEEDGIFRAIVIQRDNTKNPYTIMYDNGDTQHVVEGSLEKTGRHFDTFDNLLKQMRNDE